MQLTSETKHSILERAKNILRTLSLFQVLICVTIRSKAQSDFTGTVGGSVEIDCKYPDGYQYTPMYFCRHPCTYSDVLIWSKMSERVDSKGRYSAINTLSARRYFVTIRKLSLKDSGVYYCGVNKWGPDIMIKVKLTVSKATAVSTRAPASRQSHSSEVTTLPQTTTVITATTGTDHKHILDHRQTSTTTQTGHAVKPHELLLYVGGGVLGLLLCCVLAACVILYRKCSNRHSVSCASLPAPENQITHSPPNQEDVCHVYDEMMAVYSLAGPAIEDDSSATYSTVQLPAPADNDCNPYSIVGPH